MGGETVKMERRVDSKMGEKTERRGDERRNKETGILKLLIRKKRRRNKLNPFEKTKKSLMIILLIHKYV